MMAVNEEQKKRKEKKKKERDPKVCNYINLIIH